MVFLLVKLKRFFLNYDRHSNLQITVKERKADVRVTPVGRVKYARPKFKFCKFTNI